MAIEPMMENAPTAARKSIKIRMAALQFLSNHSQQRMSAAQCSCTAGSGGYETRADSSGNVIVAFNDQHVQFGDDVRFSFGE
jgi:hypothetical protein